MRRALVVLVVAACGKSSSPPTGGSAAAPAPSPAVEGGNSTSCANVIAKIAAMRQAPSGALDELAAQCEQGPWSEGYRTCIIAIASRDEIPTCDREALRARGVDLGGPDCEQVMDHFAQVEKLPADVYAKSKTKLLATCGALPRAVKECSLAATDHAGLAACASANGEAAR